MPKKKKTLKQKMLADTRNEKKVQSVYSFQQPIVTLQENKQSLPTEKSSHTISTINYHYLAADLRKTIFFTGFVVLIELLGSYFL